MIKRRAIRTGLAALCVALTALPATAQEAAVGYPLDDEAKTVIKLFLTAYGDICNWGDDAGYFIENPPPRWELTWSSEWSDEPEGATLYQLFCSSGAYNVNDIFYLAHEDEWEGIQPVYFPSPDVTVVNQDPDDLDSAVVDLLVGGIVARVRMTNAQFDPATGVISEHALWRGLGDASSSGTWLFRQGAFVLQTFDIDASYDGEVSAVRVLDYSAPVSAMP